MREGHNGRASEHESKVRQAGGVFADSLLNSRRPYTAVLPLLLVIFALLTGIGAAGALGIGEWESMPTGLAVSAVFWGIGTVIVAWLYLQRRRERYRFLLEAPIDHSALRRMSVTLFDFALVIEYALASAIVPSFLNATSSMRDGGPDAVPQWVWMAAAAVGAVLAVGLLIEWRRERGIRARERRSGTRLPIRPHDAERWRRAVGDGEGMAVMSQVAFVLALLLPVVLTGLVIYSMMTGQWGP